MMFSSSTCVHTNPRLTTQRCMEIKATNNSERERAPTLRYVLRWTETLHHQGHSMNHNETKPPPIVDRPSFDTGASLVGGKFDGIIMCMKTRADMTKQKIRKPLNSLSLSLRQVNFRALTSSSVLPCFMQSSCNTDTYVLWSPRQARQRPSKTTATNNKQQPCHPNNH
ncbi:unnamed protein product [Ectocarpus sp. 8 AP-2014]